MREYEPELGQMAFGQKWQSFELDPMMETALEFIGMCVEAKTKGSSPANNSGERFKNEVFEMNAYSWGDDDQELNFAWRDIRVSWYKYLGRGATQNRKISVREIVDCLTECIESMRAK